MQVVRDRVAEVFARLVDLTLGVGSSNVDGSDERVIFVAASALHQCITTAAASGAAGFPGWSWARDARLLSRQQALVLGHCTDLSTTAAAAVVAAGDENSLVANGNSGSSGPHGLSARAGRDLHALLMVQLLGKPLKKEALLRVVSHHASGGLAHPALLRLGTDLLLAALRQPPTSPPSQAARSSHAQSQDPQQQRKLQEQRKLQHEKQQRAAASALCAWSEGALAAACASSVHEEHSAGCEQLSRVLHEPCHFLWAGSPAKKAQLFGVVVDNCLRLVVRAPWDSSSSGSSGDYRRSGEAHSRSRASSTSQSIRRRGSTITSASSANSAAAANAAAASNEHRYKPALHHHWPAPRLNSSDAAWVSLALTCLPGCSVAIPVPVNIAAGPGGKGGNSPQASPSIERALLPARAAQIARLACLAPKVATRLALLGACCRVLVTDPSVLPQSSFRGGNDGINSNNSVSDSIGSECDEDVGPSPAACVATFLAHPWVEATLSNRLAHKSTGSGMPFALTPAQHSSRRSNATQNGGSSSNAGASSTAAATAVAVGMANASTSPEGDHCRHELAVALLSAVSHQWSKSMVSSELAFRRDARIVEDTQAKEAAKYEDANKEQEDKNENSSNSSSSDNDRAGSDNSDSDEGDRGHRKGTRRSKMSASTAVAARDSNEEDEERGKEGLAAALNTDRKAQAERFELLARIAARSAALRWAECAAVLLGCQELATAASLNGGAASTNSSSSGGSKRRRLVECLLWPCSDDPLLGGGDLNGVMNSSGGGGGGGVGGSSISGFGGGSNSGGVRGGGSSQQFPSGAAPSAWVRLLALTLRSVHGGREALGHEDTILVRGDEAARHAGGQRTSDWVQMKTRTATAAAAAHAELTAIDETVKEQICALCVSCMCMRLFFLRRLFLFCLR